MKIYSKVFSTVSRLEQFPKSGRKPPEFETSQYRKIVIDPCRIFYRYENETIYILYVMRSERKLRKFIIDERTQENC